MYFSRCIRQLTLLTALSLASTGAMAIDPTQTDTFEDGTVQGWITGPPHPFPPINVATGGPAGADDNYLEITALGGGGPGSRLSAFNLSQWGGDYLAAGITKIRMDVNNFGAADLALRLLLADPQFGPPSNAVVTAAPQLIAANSGWTTIEFSLNPADLVVGVGDLNAALSNVTELRLYHSPDLAFPGPAIAARLGVDNISAQVAAVPEPSSLIAFGTCAMVLISGGRIRRGRKSRR